MSRRLTHQTPPCLWQSGRWGSNTVFQPTTFPAPLTLGGGLVPKADEERRATQTPSWCCASGGEKESGSWAAQGRRLRRTGQGCEQGPACRQRVLPCHVTCAGLAASSVSQIPPSPTVLIPNSGGGSWGEDTERWMGNPPPPHWKPSIKQCPEARAAVGWSVWEPHAGLLPLCQVPALPGLRVSVAHTSSKSSRL